MTSNENVTANSSIVPADEPTMPAIQPKPSPELAGFLELVGRALAQEWIEQNASAASCAPYDIFN